MRRTSLKSLITESTTRGYEPKTDTTLRNYESEITAMMKRFEAAINKDINAFLNVPVNLRLMAGNTEKTYQNCTIIKNKGTYFSSNEVNLYSGLDDLLDSSIIKLVIELDGRQFNVVSSLNRFRIESI